MPAVKSSRARAELLEALGEEARRFSTATVLLHAAVAERLGLHPTDHKCADVLARSGPMTAGALAAATGLTTGAITGVIDRLERAGMVKREGDPADRRRVVVRLAPTPAMRRRLDAVFRMIGSTFRDSLASYGDAELSVIRDFLARSTVLAEEQIARLRDGAERATTAPARRGGSKR